MNSTVSFRDDAGNKQRAVFRSSALFLIPPGPVKTTVSLLNY